MLFSNPVKIDSASDWGEIIVNGFAPPHAEPEEFPYPHLLERLKLEPESTDLVTYGKTLANNAQGRPTIGTQLENFTEQVLHVLGGPRDFFDELDLDPVRKAQAVARVLLGAEVLVFSGDE